MQAQADLLQRPGRGVPVAARDRARRRGAGAARQRPRRRRRRRAPALDAGRGVRAGRPRPTSAGHVWTAVARGSRSPCAPRGPHDGRRTTSWSSAPASSAARSPARCPARRCRVALVEARDDVGAGTSKANTAIWHTGFDAKPGSLESRLVARGYRLLEEYADGRRHRRSSAPARCWSPGTTSSWPRCRDGGQGGHQRLPTTPRPCGADRALRARAAPRAGRARRRWWSRTRASLTRGRHRSRWRPRPWSTGPTCVLRHPGDSVLAAASDRGAPVLATDRRRAATARWVVNAAGLGSDHVDRMLGHDGFTVTPAPRPAHRVRQARRPAGARTSCCRCRRRRARACWSRRRSSATSCSARPPRTSPTGRDTVHRRRGSGVLLEHGPAAPARAARRGGHRRLRRAPGRDRARRLPGRGAPRAGYVCVGGIRSTGLTAVLALAEHVVADLGESGLVPRPGARRPRRRGCRTSASPGRAPTRRGGDRRRPRVRRRRLPLRAGDPRRDPGRAARSRPGHRRSTACAGGPGPCRALPGLLLRRRGATRGWTGRSAPASSESDR